MKSEHVRSVAAVVTITAFLLLQFLVPILQYSSDIPQRWGWQMYSRTPDSVQLYAIHDEGNQRLLPVNDHLVRFRWELRFDAELLQEICKREGDARVLLVIHELRDETERFECNP